MNKLKYRVIFNRQRRMTMVVSEIAKAYSGGDSGLGNNTTMMQGSFNLRRLTLAMAIAAGLVFTPLANAKIVADKNAAGQQRPQVILSGNGTYQVNIQTPSKAGVSHNKYQQFDVDKKGAILNNSRKNVKTELGGYVAANRNLAGGEARIILNEVNAKNPSQLNGYVEVAGQRAQVIIANPSGITCNGCGFINANKSTLTTGRPIMEDGQLKGYQVKQGEVTINGRGLDDSRSDYTEIIARSVKVNAGIWANDLNIVTGRNHVSHDVNNIAKDTQSPDNTPELALDVAALGGMYAGKIRLVGTERGVGVNNQGIISSQHGGIHLTVDGKIVNQGTVNAKQDLTLTAQRVENSSTNIKQSTAPVLTAQLGSVDITAKDALNNHGTISAKKGIQLAVHNAEKTSVIKNEGEISSHQGQITITADANILNTQNISASQNLSLKANNVESTRTSITAAGVDSHGNLIHQGTIKVNANDIKFNGQHQATNDILLNADDSLSTQYSQITASTLNANSLNHNNQSANIRTDDLTFNTGYLNNAQATLSAKNIGLYTNLFDNSKATLNATQQITINSTAIDNHDAKINVISPTKTAELTINATEINNNNARLTADILSIKAMSLTGDGDLQAEKSLVLKLKDSFINIGHLLSKGSLDLHTEGDIHNKNNIIANKNAQLIGTNIINDSDAEISADHLKLTARNQLTNLSLIEADTLNIQSKLFDNLGKAAIFGDDVIINSDSLNNLAEDGVSPIIAAREQLMLGVSQLNNRGHAEIISLGDLHLGRTVDSQGKVIGYADVINNHSSLIESGQSMILSVNTLNNINDNFQTDIFKIGEEKFDKYAHVNSTQRYDKDEITIKRVRAKRVNYTRLVTPDGREEHDYDRFQYTETLYRTLITHSEPGEIISANNLTINGEKVNNHDSRIIAGGLLAINAVINNDSTHGIERIVTDGTYTHYYRKKKKNYKGQNSYSTRTNKSNYKPADRVKDIDLKAAIAKENQSVATLAPIDSHKQNAEEHYVNASLQTVSPTITLTQSALFAITPSTKGSYLIETNPRFTQYKNWLSSDYMISMVKSDHNTVLKRLGDGFYEQRLIRQQITALTGQRYLGDYRDDNEQYKALMQSGVHFAQQYDLPIGADLSPSQMEQLTNDIVWLVEKEVTLENGQTEKVLVPQVYLANKVQVLPSGAIISGRDVSVTSEADIHSTGSIIAGDSVSLKANTISNDGIIAGDQLNLQADNNINNRGTIVGNNNVVLNAKQDINLLSDLNTETRGNNVTTTINRESGIFSRQGDIALSAGHDVNANAAILSTEGQESKLAINAGNDIKLNALTTRHKEDNTINSDNYRRTDEEFVVGSQILSQGDVTLNAGRNLTSTASTISADKSVGINATNVELTSKEEKESLTSHFKQTSKGFLSKETTTTHHELDNRKQVGSQISGDQISINAQNNIDVKGSQILSGKDVTLDAGNTVSIQSVDESHYQRDEKTTKKSGLMSSGGGLGVTIGKSKEQLDQKWNEGQQLSSVVGSTQGDVNIHAGKDVSVKGSDLIAKQDINVNGESITLKSADSTSRYDEHYKKVQSGLTLALTGSAAQVYDSAKAVHDSQQRGNDTLTALKAIQASLTAVEGYQNQQLGSDTQDKSIIGIRATLGSQKTERNVAQEQHNVVGSNLSAGDSIRLTARGDDKGESGDITLKGSEVRAGQDIDIRAAGSLNAIAAVNTQNSDRKEESSGGGVGLNLSLGGSGGFSMGLNANANFSKEREHADGSAWSESIIDAGNALNVKTGQDVNLIGSQLKGDKITADVGNQLNIQSLQDSDNFDYDKLTASVSGGYGVGSTPIEANLSLSKTEMESHWASVTDQAGIFAGAQGFDITVKDNTDLKGAVIASQAEAEHNRLDTGTLTFSDIENKADYRVDHSSLSLGTSGPTVPMTYHDKDSASNTTHSAVAQGELTVRDSDKQQQDVNSLSRETDNAHKELASIFDKQKQLDKIEVIESVVTIASQVTTVLENADKIAAEKQVADLQKDPEAYNAAVNELKNAGIITSTDNAIEVNNALITQQLAQSQLAMGGDLRQEITSATAIITGLISGNPLAGITGAAAPHLAELIKQQTENNPTLNTVSHAVLGAVVAELQGGSALAGATGAAVGENAARIIRENLYGNKPNDQLSPEEKEQITALSSLAAGLATAALSGSTIDATTSAGASKNAVENNYLNSQNVIDMKRELEEADKTGADKTAIYDKYDKISKENRDKAIAEIESGGSYDAIGAWEELNSGVNVADALKISALFDDLSSEDRAQLVNFVKAESAESAQAIYNSLSLTAKVALQGKEIAENSGIKGSLPGSGVSSLGIKGGGNKGNKQPYQPNQGAVGNMNEFLKQPNFGSQSKDSSSKTSKVYQGQSVYQASKDIGSNIKKGDQFYLDGQHKNHLEVFDKRGNFKAVLNLDGSVNQAKTDAAMGRKLK